MEQLVQFHCPAGPLPRGNARIVSWDAHLYVCNGSKFLYLFSLDRKLITAVYLFPSKISHMELETSNRQLYVLCAQSGIFLLEWDEMGRLSQEPNSTAQIGDTTVHHIGPSFCCLQDPCAVSFILACDVLVLAVQQPHEWNVKVFPRTSLRCEDPNPSPSREMKSAIKTAMPNSPLQPVLCCVSIWKEDKMKGIQCNYLLEARLFTRLFGVDLAMCDSPIILCGFPDGRVAYFPLRSSSSCYENQSSLKLLYHLEQPVVSVGATRMGSCDAEGTEQPIGSSGNAPCDCVLLIGQKGSLVSVTSGGESEDAASEYRKYPIRAPVCCTLYSTSGVIYSDHSNVFSITIPSAKDTAGAPRCSVLSSVRHNVPMIAAMSQNNPSSGDSDLVLLSSRGRLMWCRLNQKGSEGRRPGLESDNTGQRMKELLCGIGSVSDRLSRRRSEILEKRSSLQMLNQAMSMSRQLLSGDWTSGPLRCDVTALWGRMLQTDSITVSCTLENRTDCVLDRGWTLCVLIGSDVSYPFPVTSLKPGERTELTFPLPTHTYHSLHFPVKITFTLFYSLKGVVSDSALPADTSPAQQGVCIPLQEHSIDLLQCLRLGPPTSHPDQLHVMPDDVVQAFFKAANGADHHDTPPAPGVNSLAPLKARVRISASLVAQALQNENSGRPLCSAVLYWLLSMDGVKEQSLVEVQGVTPDGKDFILKLQEITVSDLTSDGGIPAIEIQILSSHLHVVASLHLAVISRFQILFQQNKNVCRTSDLDLGKVQRQFGAQESLLKELKTLKERLDIDEDIVSSTAAERLLHIYKELRDPGLFFI